MGRLREAATVVPTRTTADGAVRTLSLQPRERMGIKRAAVAVARKLAVIMHAVLKFGQTFQRQIEPTA